jgi:hypothetical protein
MLGCPGFIKWLRDVEIEPLVRSLPFLLEYRKFLAMATLRKDPEIAEVMQQAIKRADDAIPKWRIYAVLQRVVKGRRKDGGVRARFAAWADYHWIKHELQYTFDTEQEYRTWMGRNRHFVSPEGREQLLSVLGASTRRGDWVGHIVARYYNPFSDTWYDGGERFQGGFPSFEEAVLERVEYNPDLASETRKAPENAGLMPDLTTDLPGVLQLGTYQVVRCRELLRELTDLWEEAEAPADVVGGEETGGLDDDPLKPTNWVKRRR